MKPYDAFVPITLYQLRRSKLSAQGRSRILSVILARARSYIALLCNVTSVAGKGEGAVVLEYCYPQLHPKAKS